MYAVRLYVPKEAFSVIVMEVKNAGGGKYGHYAGAFNYRPVCSIYTPLPGAPDSLGVPGKEIQSTCYEIEFVCHDRYLKKVVETIRLAYPGDPPMIRITKLEENPVYDVEKIAKADRQKKEQRKQNKLSGKKKKPKPFFEPALDGWI